MSMSEYYGNRKTKFRAAATEHKAALPVAMLIALLLWRMSNSPTPYTLCALAACTATAALWITIDKKYALIRVRSQILPAIYAFLAACLLLPHVKWTDTCAACCLCTAYYYLFGAYQKPHSAAPVFHSFFFLSLGSLFFTPLICLAPFLIFYLAHHARALSWRTWWAAIVGLATPYWFKIAWLAYNGRYSLPTTLHLTPDSLLSCIHLPHPTAGLQPINFNTLLQTDWLTLAAAGLTALFTIIAATHYGRTSFNDKIRTRIFHYILIWQEYSIIAFILLQPAHIAPLTALLIMNSAPLLAHYFALGRGRNVDITFLLFILSCLTLYAYRLWHNWFPFANI